MSHFARIVESDIPRIREAKLIDYVINLLFRCRHKNLTRPVTPVRRGNFGPVETYVACLDCGSQFRYDTREMRVKEPLATPPVWHQRAQPELPRPN
jgi:hypothetical protein